MHHTGIRLELIEKFSGEERSHLLRNSCLTTHRGYLTLVNIPNHNIHLNVVVLTRLVASKFAFKFSFSDKIIYAIVTSPTRVTVLPISFLLELIWLVIFCLDWKPFRILLWPHLNSSLIDTKGSSAFACDVQSSSQLDLGRVWPSRSPSFILHPHQITNPSCTMD
jgi:hypothetical protein